MKVIVDTSSKGIQGSNTDFLISAVAVRGGFSIFTTDGDFLLFAQHLPIVLYKTELAGGWVNGN